MAIPDLFLRKPGLLKKIIQVFQAFFCGKGDKITVFQPLFPTKNCLKVLVAEAILPLRKVAGINRV